MQIELKNISKKYGKKQILRDVNLQAQSGQCIGILGSNGCGKSTLLSVLAGVRRSDSGSFLCDGRDLLQEPGTRARTVGYVPQGTPLIEELSARDNLLLWYDRRKLQQELDGGVLRMLGIGEFLKKPVHKLSGGMRKRLSIGCSVAAHPPILLLDEPTAALDLACKEQIAAYLRQYKQAGGILLLTTHDVMELQLCDAWYILKNGVLEPFVFDGNVGRLVESL